MTRFFNVAGVCFPEEHYMVDPLKRLRGVMELIRKKSYFTIHAPRQTGKTTFLHALARKLNREGNYIALVAPFEQAGYRSVTIEYANELIIRSIYSASKYQLPEAESPKKPDQRKIFNLKNYLETWASEQEKPIVLFIDEIDALTSTKNPRTIFY